jgi:hypothetical protein
VFGEGFFVDKSKRIGEDDGVADTRSVYADA